MSRFRTSKVLDKRSGPSGDEYKCELQPVWLAGHLAAKAQMGCDHIQTYEKGTHTYETRWDIEVGETNLFTNGGVLV